MRTRDRRSAFHPSRRDVLRGGAVAGSAWLFGAPRAAQDVGVPHGVAKVRLGIVGVANRGRANLDALAGEEIVALCDVDARYLADALARFPAAKGFRDFREMLAQEELDGVVVSTPDHTHATVSLAAIEKGCHVYCEKPLARSVAEVRRVTEAAAKAGVATQMGIQIHAHDNYRRVVWIVQAGAIGAVREVYVWCGKGWWAPGLPALPAGGVEVPESLDWDLWTGPAALIPYRPGFHPADWRRYWAYGGGTLGDMACHYVDLPFWALGLRHPSDVEAEGPPVHADGAPEWVHVRWTFPKRAQRLEAAFQPREAPEVVLHWHDGGRRPGILAEHGIDWGSGVLFVGEKGMLLADYDRRVLLPEGEFAQYEEPDHRALVVMTPAGFDTGPAWRIPERPREHHAQWLDGCRLAAATAGTGAGAYMGDRTGALASAPFHYAGPLTEAVLLGAVAYRCGAKLEWDGKTMTAKGGDAELVRRLIDPPAREGWRS
jgi:predicted dehydrogenase